jgi:hypothetical protein
VTIPKFPPPPRSRRNRFRVLRLARVQDLAVGGHDLEAGHVVAGQAELPGKPAHSPAEGQAADAGVETLPTVVASPDDWAARSKAPSSAPLHQGPAPARVDPDSAHQGQVNHQAVARHR